MHCIEVNCLQNVLSQEKFRRPCFSRASEPLSLIMNIIGPTRRAPPTLCPMILVIECSPGEIKCIILEEYQQISFFEET